MSVTISNIIRLIRLKLVRLRLVIFIIVILNLVFLFILVTRKASISSEDETTNHNSVKKSKATGITYRLEDLDLVDIKVPVKASESAIACPGTHWSIPSSNIKETFQWRNTAAGMRDAFVFSAYHDWRTVPYSVRIIGLSGGFFAQAERPIKFCQLWFPDAKEPLIIQADYQITPDTHGKSYTASFYNCYYDRDTLPYAVSLVRTPCDTPNNLLRIITNEPTRPYNTDFAVCVTPLNFEYDDVHQLVEMIETNRLFGAGRFTFYNYSTGLRVQKYLERYELDGLVKVIPWALPITVDAWPPDPKVEPEVHYFAQLAALNDCVYREMNRARFVVLTDLDELIVPVVRGSWRDAMQDAVKDWRKHLLRHSENNRKAETILPGAFMFRNAFFYVDWKSDEEFDHDEKVTSLKLNTLLKTNRDAEMNVFYDRSKCIVWAKAVEMLSVHHVLEFLDPSSTMHVQVSEEIGLLHHYRQTLDKMKRDSVQERRMIDFSAQIIKAVRLRHSQLGIIKV